MTLIQSLPAGTSCTIVSIEGDVNAARRARELGLIPGTVCKVVRKSPFGGPFEITTGTTRLGIRPTDGLRICVEVLPAKGSVAA